MINLPATVEFGSIILQSLEQLLLGSKIFIDLLSLVAAGIFAIVMYLAWRRITSERWILYFALTFAALSASFLLRVLLFDSLDPKQVINPPEWARMLNDVFSLFSNLFGTAAALDIQNHEPLFERKWRKLSLAYKGSKSNNLLPLLSGNFLSLLCQLLAGLSLLSILFKYSVPTWLVSSIATKQVSDALIGAPDMVFSTVCVFLMGYAIFANLAARHFRWFGPALLIPSSIYALLQIPYAISSPLGLLFHTSSVSVQAFLTLLALPLKIFLGASAYLLVMRFFGTLTELGQLQEIEFKRRQDYLASEGVVAEIAKHFSDRSLSRKDEIKACDDPPDTGFVNLVVKVPGQTERRVACIVWPNYEADKRPKVLDWKPQAGKFSPLSDEDHTKRERLWAWEELLPFVNQVLQYKEMPEEIWVNRKSASRSHYHGNMRAVFTIAIQVNDECIGCLQVARFDSRFSQMAIRQIRQIAKMLSSAVQAYRELAGLDLISILFARELSEERTKTPEQAVQTIAAILHDLFTPTLTRLYIDFGFYALRPVYKIENNPDEIEKAVEDAIADKAWNDIRFTIACGPFKTEYNLPRKQLTARVIPSYIDQPRRQIDKFIMGTLILAVKGTSHDYDRPALGLNYLHRKTAATLAADAYLDFIRDYYGEILKTLGKELSARRLNFAEWLHPITEVLVRDAGLSWVVVRQGGARTLVGDPGGVFTLENIRKLKREVKVRRFKEPEEIAKQYSLDTPHLKASHVLKLRLKDSNAAIWLGVERSGFGPELDFSSPWKTFLVNFAQIADASLSRITIPEKFRAHVEAAQLQGIIASVATTGTMFHQLGNVFAGQLNSIATLRKALAQGNLKTQDPRFENILRSMYEAASGMLETFQSFSSLTNINDGSPCRLSEAARHALKLFEVSLQAKEIRTNNSIDEDIFVRVPFYVAALALATLVGNAKDAVDNGGIISINASRHNGSVLCWVSDNGRGISLETQKGIFDPKIRTKEYGTGMGLYLTNHSLSEYESSIQLTESNENGTTFTIKFPSANKGGTTTL